MTRRYRTAWIPQGEPTYEEVFWARIGGLLLPFILLGALVFGRPSTTWSVVGFAGYLCIPADDRSAEARQGDDTDYSLPVAVGIPVLLVLAVVALSTAPVESAIDTLLAQAPTFVTTVVDVLGSVDFAALTIGGMYGFFARTAWRWHTADVVRPPE